MAGTRGDGAVLAVATLDPATLDDLAEASLRFPLTNDAARCQEPGARGRALVEERSNFSRLVEHLEQLYRSTVAAR